MSDTTPAKLPGIPQLSTDDPALARWAQAITEHVQVRAGARGNPLDKGATMRDIAGLKGTITNLTAGGNSSTPGGSITVNIGNGITASLPISEFTSALQSTQLYKDLVASINDPTRFNFMPQVVQDALLSSLADEAASRGAAITNTQTIINTAVNSLAMQINEVTASVNNANAGIRDLAYSSATANNAQAAQITQMVAALTGVGTAQLEQVYQVIADRVTGLLAQYTLKLSAGGAIAGFGISAAQDTAGNQTSAFIIEAGMFGIVSPSYNLGQQSAPPVNSIPFGVDANGVYISDNVYIKGSVVIDGPAGMVPISSVRGSLNITYTASSTSGWSDNIARYGIWQALGNTGFPVDNSFLSIGDTVTIIGSSNYVGTKTWFGSFWAFPGQTLNGNMLINGTLAASAVNTNGLLIRDAQGNVIFGAGYPLSTSNISGLGPLASLPAITPDNVGTVMEAAAIGNAYIANAAVTTLKIGANQVTVPLSITYLPGSWFPAGSWGLVCLTSGFEQMQSGAIVSAVVNLVIGQAPSATNCKCGCYLWDGGTPFTLFEESMTVTSGYTITPVFSGSHTVPWTGGWQLVVWLGNDWSSGTYYCSSVNLNGFGASR